MRRISNIGGLLRKTYRLYCYELLAMLQQRGFTDLRPSFLEVMIYICSKDGPTIKSIGQSCGLKKQTMTSHLNELERRGHIYRKVSENDRREQNIYLTEYGEKFKINLYEAINDLEQQFSDRMGDVELDRVEHILQNMHTNLQDGIDKVKTL